MKSENEILHFAQDDMLGHVTSVKCYVILSAVRREESL